MAFPPLKLDIHKRDGDSEADGEYYLTPFQESDVEELYQVLRLKDVGGWLINLPRPYTIDHAKFWVQMQTDAAKSLAEFESVEERVKYFWGSNTGLSVPVQVIRYKSRTGGDEGKGDGRFVGCVTLMRMGRFGPRNGDGKDDGEREEDDNKSEEERKEKVVEMGYYIHPDHRGRGAMVSAAIAAVRYARDVWGLRWVYVEVDRENWASWRTREKIFEGTRRRGESEDGVKDKEGGGDGVVEAETKMEVGTVSLVWPEGTIYGGHDGVRVSEWWCWRV